jgi:hypothetical protein
MTLHNFNFWRLEIKVYIKRYFQSPTFINPHLDLLPEGEGR